jgi:hypothetical protein
LELSSLRIRSPYSLAVSTLAVGLCLTGVLIVRDPVKAWLIVGAVGVLALLECSPTYWCAGAIFAATFSRTFAAIGAPHFLNFFHFPLAAGAFAVALLRGRRPKMAAPLLLCLLGLLALNIFSWILNGGEPQRPILNWLVITEPFLLLYAFVSDPPSLKTQKRLLQLLFFVSFVQVPLGVYQWAFIAHGDPDKVQGTFIGSGTGAHVAGAVAMVSMVVLFCQATATKHMRLRAICFIGAGVLLGLAVIADAKQAIAAFIPGLVLAVLKATKVKPMALLLPATCMGAFGFVAFHFYPPLQKLGDETLVSGGVQGKAVGLFMIANQMAESPVTFLVGLGPGNTVSRVALLTPDATLDANSSVSQLGLKTAPLTKRIVAASAANFLTATSSAWYPACSWFGIIGDLGIAGLAIYLATLSIAWRMAASTRWLDSSAKGSLAAMCVLGGVYSWLEEPSFTLVVMLLVTLAYSANRTRPVLICSDRRAPRWQDIRTLQRHAQAN